MAVLRKLKSSTLMETLVATVLIVMLFMISSMLLNSLFSNSLQSRYGAVDQHLLQLQYQYQNGAIALPYTETLDSWEIHIYKEMQSQRTSVVFELRDAMNQKHLSKTIVSED